ncbi:MAG: iron-containing alcohol dehydrogenase [Tissierellales bacterium]
MLNFNYSIPTKIFFGKDQIQILGKEIKKYGSKVLLAYGGGSIKKTGVYDKVVSILNEENIPYWELSGIEPNPRIESVREGIRICRENDIDFILPVGGGSTIDCAKVIAAGFFYEGDPWDLVIRKAKVEKLLPIASILTLAATGSEMDAGAVITNPTTKQKLGIGHPDMFPKFSILDPTYTFSVPAGQTAAGTADIMSHTLESYFSNNKDAFVQDKIAEGLLKTCIKYGPIAMKEPDNYEARANLMWASSLAINGLIRYGKEAVWSVHPLQHELGAYYDITHGVGLAVLTPYWMRHVLNDKTVEKFVEYGKNVWDIGDDKYDYDIANEAIDKTQEFFKSLGIPTTLKELGIGEENLEKMANAVTDYNGGTVGSFKPLIYEDVLQIYKAAL